MATKIKVLLVDDHSLVRRGFRRMLEDEADIVVIGEASNGDEAVQTGPRTFAASDCDGLRVTWHKRIGRYTQDSRNGAA